MSKLYEIVVFTASQRIYADRVLNLIDPKKRISHRMYREHCIVVNNSYYLKNLRALGRNMKDVIVVDDNNITGLLQPDNFYKIEPFDGS
jgi:TFIIF-interacting CTD phosphatase-like protein